jgi:hypothetical protein
MRRRDESKWEDLATYNSEKARGIVHTPERDAAMAAEQERFNAEQAEAVKARGHRIIR